MFLSLLLLLSLSLFLLVSLLFFSLLHQNPHLPTYPLIGCLPSFYRNRHFLLHWYTDLLSLSPTQTITINRLGARRTIVTANPKNVEHILKTNFGVYPKGKAFSEILGDFLGFGIFNVDGELWSTQRKLVSHEFSRRSLREFVVKALEEEMENRLYTVLEEAAQSRRALDLQDVLRRLTFDTICKVSLGIDPCCLDLSRPLLPLFTAFDTASEISAKRATAPIFAVWKLKRALNLGSEKKLKQAIDLVHSSITQIIRTKRQSNLENNNHRDGSGDLLSRLLSACNDDEVVRDMVISFLMAGRDTTSSAMTWLFWLLSHHPEAKKGILNEVWGLRSDTKPLDFEDLKEMKYLKACLCESMRLYPPVAWDSKHTAASDVLPDGTVVAAGDRVTYFPYGMGRMEAVWGKDRLEFRPDRWLGEPGATVSPYKFPVFQAGPRVCLGKEMALIQMKYVVASVLRRFDVCPVRPDRPVFVPLLTAHMAGGLKVMVSKRSSM